MWINVIIVSIDWMNEAKPYVLLNNNGDLPCNTLTHKTQPEQQARKIFSECVDLDSDWAKLRIMNVTVEDYEFSKGETWVTYGCIVPNDAKLLENSQWVPFDNSLYNHDWYNEISNVVKGIE